MQIYLNNYIVSDKDPMITVQDRGFLLADGLFETIKIVQGRAEYLQEHLERLFQGAEVLCISHDLTFDKISDRLDQLIAINQFEESMLSARLTLTRGPGPRGLSPPEIISPTVMLTVSPYHPLPDHPLKLFVSSIRRNEFSPTSQLKTLSYTDNILARMEALQNGADEALMLNTQGFVACAASGNIFIEKNGILLTPPLTEGVLPGIMRAQILEQQPSQERRLTLEDCLAAEAVYVTNGLIGQKKAEVHFSMTNQGAAPKPY
jgi:branched-chain amino acid aminotransferase